jgi:hypothetical protein
MKGVTVGCLIVLLSFADCSKSSSGPSTAEGKWTYTTPDSKIVVTFDLVKTSSGSMEIQNQTMKIDGTACESVVQTTGVNLPDIESIRISANDSKVTYPYYIKFLNAKVSSDFKRMDVPSGEYTFPWGTTKTLTSIAIVRP